MEEKVKISMLCQFYGKLLTEKQYELIKSILNYLLENEYPYISYILGGYKSLHDMCIKYNIPIIVKSTFIENDGTIVK